jgi:hypothetical protein
MLDALDAIVIHVPFVELVVDGRPRRTPIRFRYSIQFL